MSECLWTFPIGWAAGPTSIATRAVCYCCTQSVIIFCNSSAASVTLKTRKLPTKSIDKTWWCYWNGSWCFQECASKLWKGLQQEQDGSGCRLRAVSHFLFSHSRLRELPRVKQRKFEQEKIRVLHFPISAFTSPRQEPMSHRLLHLHNFTFLLAARGSQERRTTACGLEWEQLSYTPSLKKFNLHVNP